MALFTECFSGLSDPRTGNAQRHDFLELLIIARLATLSGAESCVDFEVFARSKEGFLREFLALDGGVPSHDTFSWLFRLIDPQALAACPQRFALELGSAAGQAGVVAIDGKGLRTALARARSATPLALVNAFASDCGLALGPDRRSRRDRRDRGAPRASGSARHRGKEDRNRRRHSLPEGDRASHPRQGR